MIQEKKYWIRKLLLMMLSSDCIYKMVVKVIFYHMKVALNYELMIETYNRDGKRLLIVIEQFFPHFAFVISEKWNLKRGYICQKIWVACKM